MGFRRKSIAFFSNVYSKYYNQNNNYITSDLRLQYTKLMLNLMFKLLFDMCLGLRLIVCIIFLSNAVNAAVRSTAANVATDNCRSKEDMIYKGEINFNLGNDGILW